MNKLFIKVTPGAKFEKVEHVDAKHFKVWVTAKAEHGKANTAVLKALAVYLAVPVSLLSIKRGARTKTKLIAINVQDSLAL